MIELSNPDCIIIISQPISKTDNEKATLTGTCKLALIRNKFDCLTAVFSGNIDILFITETKIDSTFPKNLFYLNGCSMHYRHDRNTNGVDISVYVRDDIRSRITDCENLPSSFEGLVMELSFNLKSGYWSASTILMEKVLRIIYVYFQAA